MKCGVLVRFVYEFIYLDAFIEHYLDLGFDKIVILYHDVVEGYLKEEHRDRVLLYSVPNLGNKLPDAYKKLIPHDIDWVFHVDSDEFLLLHKRYDRIHDYVREKINTYPKANINLIAMNWLWIHKFDDVNQSVNEIIKKYMKQVGNAVEQKKKELWIKCIFKRSELQTLYIHCPLMKTGHRMYGNGELITFKNNMNSVRSVGYKNMDKIYDDHALVHVATRSLKNAIFKSERIHNSQVQKKNMVSKMELEREISFMNDDVKEFEVLKLLLEYVGYKVRFPLKCLKLPEANINLENLIRVKENRVNFESIDNSDEYYRLYSSLINNSKTIELINKVVNKYNNLFMN